MRPAAGKQSHREVKVRNLHVVCQTLVNRGERRQEKGAGIDKMRQGAISDINNRLCRTSTEVQ